MIKFKNGCIMKCGSYANTRNLDFFNAIKIKETLIVSNTVYQLLERVKDSYFQMNKIIEKLTFK